MRQRSLALLTLMLITTYPASGLHLTEMELRLSMGPGLDRELTLHLQGLLDLQKHYFFYAYDPHEVDLAKGAVDALMLLGHLNTPDVGGLSWEYSEGREFLRIPRSVTNAATQADDELLANFLFVIAFGMFDLDRAQCVVEQPSELAKMMTMMKNGDRPTLLQALVWVGRYLSERDGFEESDPAEFVRYIVDQCRVARS